MLGKDAIARAIVLLFVMALTTSAAGAADRRATDGCTGATSLGAGDDAVDAIVCLINRERVKRGLRAVHLSQQLSQSATVHSEDMARRKFFSHVSPDGVRLRQRVYRSGYVRNSRNPYVGETIAWGGGEFGTPRELVRCLMASSGHRRIVLDGRFRDVGVGLTTAVPVRRVSGRGATLTLAFGRR